MANGSLASSSYSSNPVSFIHRLIHAALKMRCAHPDECHVSYQQALASVAGLGFTAVLAEGRTVEACMPYWETFLKYRNFLQQPSDSLSALSDALMHLIMSALSSFEAIGHPMYYDQFVLHWVALLRASNIQSSLLDMELKQLIYNFISEVFA